MTEQKAFDHFELVEPKPTEPKKERRPVGRRKRAEPRPPSSETPKRSNMRSGAAVILMLCTLGVGLLKAVAKAERTAQRERDRDESDVHSRSVPAKPSPSPSENKTEAPPGSSALLTRLEAALPAPGKETDAMLVCVDGLRMELEGLTVERRHFDEPEAAQREVSRKTSPASELRVVELRSCDVVVLTGAMLEQPAAAARGLALVWGLHPVEEGPRSIAVVPPLGGTERWKGDLADLASFSFQPEGVHHQLGASHLQAVRDNDGRNDNRTTIRCLDGAAENVGYSGLREGSKHSEATATTMLYAQGHDFPAMNAAKDRLTALLEALGSPAPTVPTTQVELIAKRAAP